MNSFEWNKIAGAVLASVLVVIVINNLGHGLFHVEPLEEQAYVVEGVVEEGTAVAEEEPAEEVTPLPVLLADASADRGARVFRRCAACHSVNPADGNRSGPNLHGVVGEDVARLDDFSYSNAMQSVDGEWDFDKLNKFLESPRDYVSGTTMSFAGLRRPEERADIIVFLNENSDNPVPLPEVEETAAEETDDNANGTDEPAAEDINDDSGDGDTEENNEEENGDEDAGEEDAA